MSLDVSLSAPLHRDLDAPWAGPAGRQAAVAAITAQLFPGAAGLPLTTFCRAHVHPVVVWDRRVLANRLHASVAPATSPDAVSRLIYLDVESPLRAAGMIGVGRPTAVRRSLKPLRSLCRTVAAFAQFPARSPLVVEEFDAQGTALVVSGGDGVVVYAPGDPGPMSGAALSPLWRRVYEERLFDWALRSNALPVAFSAERRPSPTR
ncbi:hypothetical protein [Microbacterium hominis]|uniref:hypothetical protein n=1 Tax=Microbacterium hominis TaxID=162426 RepID=UPI00077CA1DD|nr:hypothetical protein [Microbacterium hominis]